MSRHGGDQPPHGIDIGTNYVVAWSTTRLPFEPRGEMKAFRDKLRSAISRLHAEDDQGLLAIYSSPRRDFCDVENIVIYNVGASAFRNSARSELAFQRTLEQHFAVRFGMRVATTQDPMPTRGES